MPADIRIRNPTPENQPRGIGVIKAWWDGRDLSHMLPRLFFVHFCDTSFVMERESELVAFLVGFFLPEPGR
ncbi:MAG TPA: hypothetical protein ENF48_07910 [Desulfobacteraceae bacterium]|nr:hypothetical protein [Deltaproteobacteria bacterium]HDI60260.1 hypothetical protein [Desulfobacteraceae bacterium]